MEFLKFQNQFSINTLPLTISMVEKNDYEDAEVCYTTDNDGLSSVCIYTDHGPFIKVEVLEVRSDCRNQNYGTKLINRVKSFKKPIVLNSMPDAMSFYEKQGFKHDQKYRTYMRFKG